MTMNEYQQLAQRTSNTHTISSKIENGCMELNGEAGECIDLLKKYLYQEHELDKEKMAEELGDVLWYCAKLAKGLGITLGEVADLSVTLGEVAERNIDKLRRRYPEGFDAERSINREE